MARTTAHSWSQQVTEHSDAPRALHMGRAGAQLPETEKNRFERVKDALRSLCQSPSSGRTTRLGRRVEKPGSGSPDGPSGQKDGTKHDGKHTNK